MKKLLAVMLSCLAIIAFSNKDSYASTLDQSTNSSENDFSKGMAYYDSQNYTSALSLLTKAANQGNAIAQAQLNY